MRRFLFYTSLLVAFWTFPAGRCLGDSSPLLLDLSGTLSHEQFERVEAKLGEISSAKQFDLALLIIAGRPTPNLRDYAYIQLAMRGMNYGGPARALLIIDIKAEETHLAVSQESEPYLSPGVGDWISEHVLKKSVRLSSLESDTLATLEVVAQLLRSSVEKTPPGLRECSPLPSFFLHALIMSLALGLFLAELLRLFLSRHIAAFSSMLVAYLIGTTQFPLFVAIPASFLTLVFAYCDIREISRVWNFSDKANDNEAMRQK